MPDSDSSKAELPEVKSPYELIGGAAAVRQLVGRFYDVMDSELSVNAVRQMHAKSLRVSREKLTLFLSGWLGGPDLYVQKYGHPRLRQRHLPFAIDEQARDQWMHCMIKALAEQEMDTALREQLQASFWRTADHMRNQQEA